MEKTKIFEERIDWQKAHQFVVVVYALTQLDHYAINLANLTLLNPKSSSHATVLL